MCESGSIQKALNLVQSSRYGEALPLLITLAQADVVEAQAALGVIYQLGLDCERDVTKAFEWLIKAANAGSAIAAHNLGTLYQTCAPEFEVDADKSRFWYGRACSLGFDPSSPA